MVVVPINLSKSPSQLENPVPQMIDVPALIIHVVIRRPILFEVQVVKSRPRTTDVVGLRYFYLRISPRKGD